MDEKVKKILDRVKDKINNGWYSITANDDEWKAILALLSEKDKEIEEIIQDEWQCCHAYNNEIVSENQKLKARIKSLEEGIEKLKDNADSDDPHWDLHEELYNLIKGDNK